MYFVQGVRRNRTDIILHYVIHTKIAELNNLQHWLVRGIISDVSPVRPYFPSNTNTVVVQCSVQIVVRVFMCRTFYTMSQ